MSERERIIKYNPADYKAVEDKAKAMDKKELEDYYVKDRDRRHISCGEGWAIAFGVILVLAVLIGLGYTITDDILKSKVENNMKDISIEVCPMLGEGYFSSEALHSGWDETRIVCNEFNSVPK